MDFPKSVEGIGLVGNRFVNENPATGQIGSLIASEWCNALTDELIAVIQQAGFEPSESNNAQLKEALNKCWLRVDTPQELGSPAQKNVRDAIDAQSGKELRDGINKIIEELDGTQASGALEVYLRNYADVVARQGGMPSGTIIAYAGKSVPAGFLLCNGGAVSRTTYKKLFDAIGVTYGGGDGVNTFNLPNLHRRFAEFTTTTSEVGQKIEAGLPDISGSVSGFSAGGYGGTITSTEAFTSNKDGENRFAFGDYKENMCGFSLNASRSSSLYGATPTVQPSSVRVLPLIKL